MTLNSTRSASAPTTRRTPRRSLRAARAVLAAALLAQELGRVADRGEGVPDLVRDVRRQPPQRGELELLRLLARARGVFQEEHAEHLLGAGVEHAHADVAAAHLEIGG